MNARDYSPIPVGKVAPAPTRPVLPPSLRFERAEMSFTDSALNKHLSDQDTYERNDEAARRNVNDKHIAEAVDMVKTNLQDRIEAGQVEAELGEKLLAIFERIEEVAVECSWADLSAEVSHG